MSFALYIVGFILVIAGLAVGASKLGVSQFWIGIGVVVLIGFAILTGVVKTRHRDTT